MPEAVQVRGAQSLRDVSKGSVGELGSGGSRLSEILIWLMLWAVSKSSRDNALYQTPDVKGLHALLLVIRLR